MQHSQIASPAVSPVVSYVLACYNHEPYIEQMIRSILNQSVKELELLILDDSSTDGSLKIIQELASQDSRIRLIPSPKPGENIGIVSARNMALQLACAEFVSIVDSDDLLPEDRTERFLNCLRSDQEIALAYGDAWLIDSNDRRIMRFHQLHPVKEGNLAAQLFCNYCFVPAISVMFRREALLKSGPLWGAGASCDYIKWIELGIYGRCVRILGRPLGNWRQHKNNLSQVSGPLRAKQYQDLLSDLKTLLIKHPSFQSSLEPSKVKKRYAGCHFNSGFYFGLSNDWSAARKEFLMAWRTNPDVRYALAWLSSAPLLNRISLMGYRLVESYKFSTLERP